MQAAQNLAAHRGLKLYLHQPDNLSSHGHMIFVLSLSPRHEKLRKILIRGVRAENEAITPIARYVLLSLGRRQP